MRSGPKGPSARKFPRSLPFSIGRPLLDFLGSVREHPESDFVAESLARAKLGAAGERAALRQGFIERSTERIGVATGSSVVPFAPVGAERHGFKLTRHGRLLGEIGKRARQACVPPTAWDPFIREAQLSLDEAIRESNVRAA